MKTLLALLLLTTLTEALPRSLPPSTQKAHKVSVHQSKLGRHLVRHGKNRKTKAGAATPGSGNVIENARIRYLLPITVGSQTVDAEIDSGASDFWLVQKGFNCYQTYDGSDFVNPQSSATCNFGTPYTVDSSFKTIKNVHQFTCYGGGSRCVEGPLGKAAVKFCGLSVNQVMGAPKNTSYQAAGKAEQSGIIGLAFSSLTTEIHSDGSTTQYTSIMDTLFKTHPTLPKYFSLAASRDAANTGNGGLFTIGGIPQLNNPNVNVSSTTYSSAPLQRDGSGALSFYSIFVDGFGIGGASVSNTTGNLSTKATTYDAKTEVFIDSGAPGLYLPQDVAAAVNNLWSPPPASDGTLDCNAVLKQNFGVTIGGTTYYMKSEDLMNPWGDGTCYSTVFGVDGGFMLGDPFLRNVLAIYDWANLQMSFYPRMNYLS